MNENINEIAIADGDLRAAALAVAEAMRANLMGYIHVHHTDVSQVNQRMHTVMAETLRFIIDKVDTQSLTDYLVEMYAKSHTAKLAQQVQSQDESSANEN